MEYFAGIKLFNKVIDRLGVDMTIFMRLACERRRASEIGIADSCNDLGAMAWAIAPELV